MIDQTFEHKFKAMGIACQLAKAGLDYVESKLTVGMSTKDVDDLVAEFALTNRVKNAPLGYRGFPANCCTSLNEVLCHGVPSKDDVLKDGDKLNVDVTFIYDGYHGDSSRTFLIGKKADHPAVASIIKTSELVTEASIRAAQANLSIREIGKAAYDAAFSMPERVSGFQLRPGTVIVCGGHGINTVFHDSPFIPSFDDGNNDLIPVGTFFTIEPHISLWSSNYTVGSIEGSAIKIIKVGTKFNAATEHTCVMTDTGLIVLTR